VSTLLLLASTFVPHHHHYDRIFCLVMERCEQDGMFNDEHTGHEHSSEGEMFCILETKYVVSEVRNEIKCKVVPCDRNHTFYQFLPACLRTNIPAVHAQPLFAGRLPYEAGAVFYQSVLLNSFNGLRAPPVLS
jgi:hypothetical protein